MPKSRHRSRGWSERQGTTVGERYVESVFERSSCGVTSITNPVEVFASPLGSRHRSNDERVVFAYAGCEIVIDGGDELTARLLEDRQERE